MVFSESRLKEIEEIKHRYPEGRHKSALLPVLHLAQEDHGWLPVDVMDEVVYHQAGGMSGGLWHRSGSSDRSGISLP